MEYIHEPNTLLLSTVSQAGYFDVDDVRASLGPDHGLVRQYLLVGFK